MAIYIRNTDRKSSIIYVVGPLRDGKLGSRDSNINLAADVAVELWRSGWGAVYCPHLNSGAVGLVSRVGNEELLIHSSLLILRKCDAVAILPGWENSEGSKRELRVALRLSTIVLFLVSVVNEKIHLDSVTGGMLAAISDQLYPNGYPVSPCTHCMHFWHADRKSNCRTSCEEYHKNLDEQAAGLV
jgi:hypothetical protein